MNMNSLHKQKRLKVRRWRHTQRKSKPFATGLINPLFRMERLSMLISY